MTYNSTNKTEKIVKLKNQIMSQELIVGVNISELPDPFVNLNKVNKVRN